MNTDPWNWKLEDLNALIGQSESMRLEFKRSDIVRLLSDKLTADLCKEVTAFANTEGGVIVIGIEEGKVGKSRVAQKLDQGINISEFPPERIQQMVESNIFPVVTGIRFHPVFLDASYSHYYLIIVVPKGSTAYQAKDYLYYRRHEFECLPLRDYEIRLLMNRGRFPDAVVDILDLEITKGAESHVIAEDLPIIHEYWNYSFGVIIHNTGEINLNHFKVRLQFTSNEFNKGQIYERTYRDGHSLSFHYLSALNNMVDEVSIFPGDRFQIDHFEGRFGSQEEFLDRDVYMTWQLFLPDRTPITDSISLLTRFPGQAAIS